jgi:hypothetical protein
MCTPCAISGLANALTSRIAAHGPFFLKKLRIIVLLTANAGHQARLKAGARYERTLEAVACKRLLGLWRGLFRVLALGKTEQTVFMLLLKLHVVFHQFLRIMVELLGDTMAHLPYSGNGRIILHRLSPRRGVPVALPALE